MVVYSKLYLFKGVIKILITVMLFCFSLTSNAQRPSNKDSLPSVKLLSRVQENQILLRWAVNEPLAWKKTNTSGFAFGADIAVVQEIYVF